MSSEWIQKHESEKYVDSFEKSTFSHNGSYGFYNIQVEDTNFQIIFPDGEEENMDLVSQAREVLSQLKELDRFVQSNTVDGNFEFSLGSIQIRDNQADLEYSGDDFNTAWGAYFKRDGNGEWYMDDWG